MTFQAARRIALTLPGVEEGSSYGTPAFRVRGKFIARLKEDGDSLVLKVDLETRDALMEADPEVFYITDHYVGYPAVLARLSKIDAAMFRSVLEEAWRRAAPKRLVATKFRPRRRASGAEGRASESPWHCPSPARDRA
jgi:hypothetical protein